MTKDCPEKPSGIGRPTDEELLFGFWMRAPNPMRRNFNWNRKWVHGERIGGGEEHGRDRDSRFTSPSLEGAGVGNNRVNLGGNSGILDVGRKVSDSNHPDNQESEELGNLVINSKRDVSGLILDYLGEKSVSGTKMGQGESLGLYPIRLQGNGIRDKALDMGFILGLAGASSDAKPESKRDEEIGLLAKAGPVLSPTLSMSKGDGLKSQTGYTATEIRATSGNWKRRARNQGRESHQGVDGVLVGSKQKVSGTTGSAEGAKKQKVASCDGLPEADRDGSAGRFQPACREQ
ncbi:hypothetical protein Q3G72_027554 [Acer saccharum]|nr:hypothetical protein Q3G72_027554 [Acer saccharum]